MAGFSSIDDLLKQESGAGGQDVAAAQPQVAPKKTADALQKKMASIKQKEDEREAQKLAAEQGLPHIDLEKFPVSQDALRQLPLAQVKELKTACFYVTSTEARLAAVDPQDPAVAKLVDTFEEERQLKTQLYVMSHASFERILRLYETLPTIEDVTHDVTIDSETLQKVQADVDDFSSFQALISRGTTTDLVAYILGAGLKLDASDVHIEPEEEQVVIRFRVDGILQDAASIKREGYEKLLSRVKLLAGLKLNITAEPQDGRFTIKLKDNEVDVRVSNMPTVYGESVVMRLLKQNREGLGLDTLGLDERQYAVLTQEIARPNGMIITTGPTGSGKTTTLYAIMQMLNKPEVKIITLENPVEYKMSGINQSQVEKESGYTFAKGLKSILRQDPDIAMVGEIRDFETAEIAVQAALTGHLMLSTLHTNSAAGAVPRFLSMGVKPFLLAPSLNAIIGQRLVRRICEKCKKEVQLEQETLSRVQEAIERMPTAVKSTIDTHALTFYAAAGCDACNNVGYSGRVGIYEILVVDAAIEEMILNNDVSEQAVEKKAIENGMTTMVQDGIMKALQGVTTIDEVFRVIE